MEKLLPAPTHTSASDAGKILAVAGLIAIIAASQSGSDSLAAPTDLSPPGTAHDPARPRYCGGFSLTWKPVAGAKDYAVTLEPIASPLARSAAVPGAPTTFATGTHGISLPGGLYGLYRWHVVARNGGRSSPPSEPAHIACPG